MTNECWQWNGTCLEEPPEGYYGFTYLITNIRTGKIYVGKKCFTYTRKTKLSKKARSGSRKRVERKVSDSGWLNYYGSSKELHEDIKKLGKKAFRREVLHFCRNKSELSYYELYEQIHREVLLIESYNSWIGAKIFKRNLSA